MYTEKNFRSKKELKEAVTAYNNSEGNAVRLQDGFLEIAPHEGTAFVEGPHYPKPHSFYAEVTVEAGAIIKVK